MSPPRNDLRLSLLAQGIAAIKSRDWRAASIAINTAIAAQPASEKVQPARHPEKQAAPVKTIGRRSRARKLSDMFQGNRSMIKKIQIDYRHEQAALVKIIGERFRAARELCNMSQVVAAQQLGYANPSKLSKVENATDTVSVPLWLIAQAARVYEVSTDYLLGFSDDWEIGVPRGAQPWLLDLWQKARERDMAQLVRLHNEVAAVSQHITALVAGAREAASGLEIFCERNPEFADMPASATLDGRLTRLQEQARAADAALKRFRLCSGSESEARQ
jgi:transcriptional regulator with XRE-family HTH domain